MHCLKPYKIDGQLEVKGANISIKYDLKYSVKIFSHYSLLKINDNK